MPGEEKYIGLMRHGLSEDNPREVYQRPEAPLHLEGIKDIYRVSETLKSLDIEKIICSPDKRAEETARIVAEVLELDYEKDEELHEKRDPKILEGTSWFDEREELESARVFLNENLYKDKTFDDYQESYFDLERRAAKKLEHLSDRREEKILVVAHSMLIRAMVSVIERGIAKTEKQIKQSRDKFSIPNAGVIFIKKLASGKWEQTTVKDLSVVND